MPAPYTIVAGFLPTNFPAKDAPTIIELAAAVLAVMAAVGNGDGPMVQGLLRDAAARSEHLPKESRDMLFTISGEIIDAVRQGKDFRLLGTFEGLEPPAGAPADRQPDPATQIEPATSPQSGRRKPAPSDRPRSRR